MPCLREQWGWLKSQGISAETQSLSLRNRILLFSILGIFSHFLYIHGVLRIPVLVSEVLGKVSNLYPCNSFKNTPFFFLSKLYMLLLQVVWFRKDIPFLIQLVLKYSFYELSYLTAVWIQRSINISPGFLLQLNLSNWSNCLTTSDQSKSCPNAS